MTEPLSRQTAVAVARQTLELDDKPGETVPDFYLNAIEQYLVSHPDDTNFIVEFARPGRSGIGGNGFGTATCMENYCWKDVILGADPERPEGGKADGFGCLWEYQSHCSSEEHVKGKAERLRQRKPKAAETPTSTGASSSQPHLDSSQTRSQPISSQALQQALEPRPTGKAFNVKDALAVYDRVSQTGMGQGHSITASGQTAASRPGPSTSGRESSATSGATQAGTTPTPEQASLPARAGPSTLPYLDLKRLLAEDEASRQRATSGDRSSGTPGSVGPSQSRSALSDIDRNNDRKPDIARTGNNAAKGKSVLRQTSSHGSSTSKASQGSGTKHDPAYVDSSDSDDDVQALTDADLPVGLRRKPTTTPKSGSLPPVYVPGTLLQVLAKTSAPARSARAAIPAIKAEPAPQRSLAAPAAQTGTIGRPIVPVLPQNPPPSRQHVAFGRPAEAANSERKPEPTNAERFEALLDEHVFWRRTGESIMKRYPGKMPAFESQLLKLMDSRVRELKTWRYCVGYIPYPPPPFWLLRAYSEASVFVTRQGCEVPDFTKPITSILSSSSAYPSSASNNAVASSSSAPLANSQSQATLQLSLQAKLEAGLDASSGSTMPGYWPQASSTPFGSVSHVSSALAGTNPPPSPGYGPLEENYMFGEMPLGGENPAEYFQRELDDFAEDADIEAGLAKLGLQSLQDLFAEMTVTLMPHQVLGVSWMLEKEKDKHFKGGLLCDAMGLGKTVQTIATIVGHMSEDRKCKTTLIIAPLALLHQWKAEIESKTTPGLLKVVIHHGNQRSKSVNVLKQADIVLTTYGTVVSEFGKDPKKMPTRAQREDSFIEEDTAVRVRQKGPLHKVNWYRVVLDEAHTIRNRKTRAAQAVWDLEAVYRWSLTGTLINNSLDDIFPHLRFLMISPCREWDDYQKHIGYCQRPRPKLAAKRAQAILRTCMLRRHKESELNGRRLLELPPKTEELVELDFSPEERLIYDSVETRMRIKINHFLRQGTVMKHYSCVLTWLMRLRQLTCHPWLLRRNPGDIAHPEDWEISDSELFGDQVEAFEAARDSQAAVDTLGHRWVLEVTGRLKQRHERLQVQEGGDEAEKELECPICMEPMEQEAIAECKHSFCKTCISELFDAPARDVDMSDEQTTRGCRKCPICRQVMEKNRFYLAVAFFDPEKEKDDKPKIEEVPSAEEPEEKPKLSDKVAGKRKAVDSIDEKPSAKRLSTGSGSSSRQSPIDVDGGEDENAFEQVLPSTKMKYLAERLADCLAEDGSKVIVFSQFVTYLNLVGIHLTRLGVGHRYYVGSMKHDERDHVVKEFTAPIKDEDSPRVMLISTKCGGVGLNLTAANKVIMLDLSWSPAPENQAIDRAHRIGQTKPVDVRRVVIRGTVEQRILELQQRKMALADGAMGEGGGIARLGRLSVQDLVRLFGSNSAETE